MRHLPFLMLTLGCSPEGAEHDVGTLCIEQGTSLVVVFDTCTSSGTTFDAKACTAEEVDGEWVVSTSYLVAEQGAVTDCVVIDAPCPSPPDPTMPVRFSDDDAVTLTDLPTCSVVMGIDTGA